MTKVNSIGKYLAAKRNSVGLTQKEMAKALKVHVQFISNIERGVAACPPYVIRSYVELCGISRREIESFLLRQYS